jgi:YihY family inner membrane protein
MGRIKSFFKAIYLRVLALLLQKPLFFNAAAISFNVFICILPIALIIISALGFLLNSIETYEQVERTLKDFMPTFLFERLEVNMGGKTLLHQLIDPIIQNRNINGIIGIIALSFFSQGLFSAIGHTLHDIFSRKDLKPAWRVIIRNYITFGVFGGVVIGFSMLIQTASIIDSIRFTIPFSDRYFEISLLWQMINLLTSIFLSTALVYVLFRRSSGLKLSRKTALFAGILFSLLFESAKMILSWYFNTAFESYQDLYQSYTLVLMIGLWIYYIGILFNLTAIITRAIHDVLEW